MKKKLEREVKGLKDNSIILTILPNRYYHELNLHLVKLVTKIKPSGAYVSMNRPYKKITTLMSEKGIDHSKILFIDCVTKKEHGADNCIFLKSIDSLVPLGVALNAVYSNKEHSFIFLDSLDAISVYHNNGILIKFIRNFVEKIRENDKIGLMIGLREGTDKKVVDDVAAICDKIIDLS